jgi:hypothetical protein
MNTPQATLFGSYRMTKSALHTVFEFYGSNGTRTIDVGVPERVLPDVPPNTRATVLDGDGTRYSGFVRRAQNDGETLVLRVEAFERQCDPVAWGLLSGGTALSSRCLGTPSGSVF